jgi:hypothetical protein
MDNEATYHDLTKLLMTMGMAPAPAKQYAARAFQEGRIHVWANGIVSCMIDGRVDSSAHALHNVAARMVAGAPTAEVRGGPTYEERQELKAEKLQRDGSDYGF